MEKQKEIERLKALTYTDIYYEMESLKNTITELNQALQLQQTGVKRCFSDDHIGIIARNIAKEYAFENEYMYKNFEEAITKGMKIGRKVIQQNNA